MRRAIHIVIVILCTSFSRLSSKLCADGMLINQKYLKCSFRKIERGKKVNPYKHNSRTIENKEACAKKPTDVKSWYEEKNFSSGDKKEKNSAWTTIPDGSSALCENQIDALEASLQKLCALKIKMKANATMKNCKSKPSWMDVNQRTSRAHAHAPA